VKILIFEEFVKDPKKTLNEILSFLKIDYELDDFEGEAYNKFAVARGQISQFILRQRIVRNLAERIMSPLSRRTLKEKFLLKNEPKPKMRKEDKEILIKFYREDVEKIQNILGRKLPWENFQ